MMNWLRRLDAKHSNFLFLIGAMKCGTTSLARALDKHPAIFTGAYKEPNFFADKGSKLADERAYLESWNLKKTFKVRDRWLLDASTSYSKYPSFGDAAASIARFTKKARFIYLMRDPIARIESQLGHAHNRQEDFPGMFEEAKERPDFYQHFLCVSSYASQLERYAALFGEDALLLLRFEDLIAEPEQTIGIIWPFLGLEMPDVTVLEHRNARKDKKVPQTRLLPAAMEVQLRESLKPEMDLLQKRWGVDVAKWGF